MSDKNPYTSNEKRDRKSLSIIMTIVILICLLSIYIFQLPSHTDESLTPKVWKGMHSNITFRVEVANTQKLREKGLMKRDTLAEDSGMLFVFNHPEKHCFWMKETYIPLSLAFIDADGTIASINDLEPLDETPVCSSRPVIQAIEMSQGWFSDNDIQVGDSIRFFGK